MMHSLPILAAGFVAPAFAIAGVMLASIPVIIHLLNRRRFKTVQWAAMDFLLRAMRKNRRRLQFESWLLLAVRCLVLALLGLALARPMGCEESSVASIIGEKSGLHVIILDNSYSMAFQADRPEARTHLDHAKRMATQLIERLNAGGESVALVTGAAPAGAVLSLPTYDLTAAASAVARVEQASGATDLAGAMQLALQIGRDDGSQQNKRLHIFSDATRSAWDTPQSETARQVSAQLAQVFRISHYNLGRPDQTNGAVVALRPSSNLVTNRFGSDMVASVSGFGSLPETLVQWRLDDQPLPGTTSVRPTPDATPVVQGNAIFRTGGPHVVSATVASGDRLRLDDTRWRVVDVQSDLKVLIVEGERGTGLLSGSGAFLSLALAPPRDSIDGSPQISGNMSDSYVAPDVISDLELGNKVLGDYSAVVLCGVGQIPTSQADQFRAFVRTGGTLILFMGEQVSEQNYNSVLLSRGLLPGALTRRVSVASDQKGFTFDFNPQNPQHPYLEVFRGEEKSGLDTAQVFTYWQVELPRDSKTERVLNYVNTAATPRLPGTGRPAGSPADGSAAGLSTADQNVNPDPAITAHTLGDGRVVFVSTTASADWTSLPAKPAYVTLVHELLAGSVTTGDRWMNLTVGESLTVPSSLRLGAAPTLRDATQKDVVLTVAQTADGQTVYRSAALSAPGVYTLSTGQRTYPIAVNVPDNEADVRTLDDAGLKAAFGDVDVEFFPDQLPAPTVASTDSGFDYGWPLMAMLLVLVCAECLMAMRFGHYRKATPLRAPS